MLTTPQISPTPVMPPPFDTSSARLLASNLAQTRERITAAATRYGRDPASLTLLAVSKQQPVEAIRAAIELGQCEFGENYLQEALPKLDVIGPAATWHFIGQIQSNKTRSIAERFSWAHTLDRLKIAERLHEQRPELLPPLNVCIQLKLGEEAGKGGVAPSAAGALARAIARLSRLRLRGIMCIPPPRERFDEQLAFFRESAECFRALRAAGFDVDTLSMGMSDDLEAAIAAGATIVRVGTGIFGRRASEG